MEKQEFILQLKCHKHIKMFKLKNEGLSNKQIAELLGTNVGHVYNEMKKYGDDQSRREAADSIQC